MAADASPSDSVVLITAFAPLDGSPLWSIADDLAQRLSDQPIDIRDLAVDPGTGNVLLAGTVRHPDQVSFERVPFVSAYDGASGAPLVLVFADPVQGLAGTTPGLEGLLRIRTSPRGDVFVLLDYGSLGGQQTPRITRFSGFDGQVQWSRGLTDVSLASAEFLVSPDGAALAVLGREPSGRTSRHPSAERCSGSTRPTTARSAARTAARSTERAG